MGLLAHGGWQALGCHDGLPGGHFHVGHTSFGHGGHIRQHGRALGAGHGQGAHLAALDVLQHRVHVLERGIHLATHQVGVGWGATLVRHVDALGVGLLPEQLHGQVVAGAVTRRSKGHLAGVGLLVGHHVGQGLVGRIGGHHQHVRRLHGHGDVVEVFQCIELQAGLDQVRHDDQRAQRGHQEGVAIGRSTLDERGANGTGGTGLVVHQKGLLELVGQQGGHRTGHLVGGAAGWERHHHRHALLGPGLGRCAQGPCGQGGSHQQFFHTVSWIISLK